MLDMLLEASPTRLLIARALQVIIRNIITSLTAVAGVATRAGVAKQASVAKQAATRGDGPLTGN